VWSSRALTSTSNLARACEVHPKLLMRVPAREFQNDMSLSKCKSRSRICSPLRVLHFAIRASDLFKMLVALPAPVGAPRGPPGGGLLTPGLLLTGGPSYGKRHPHDIEFLLAKVRSAPTVRKLSPRRCRIRCNQKFCAKLGPQLVSSCRSHSTLRHASRCLRQDRRHLRT